MPETPPATAVSITGLPVAAELSPDDVFPVVRVGVQTTTPSGETSRVPFSVLLASLGASLQVNTDQVADLSDLSQLVPPSPGLPSPPTLTASLSQLYQQLQTLATQSVMRVPAHITYNGDIDVTTLVVGTSVSGRVLVADDRVLLWSQTDASENGLWRIVDGGPPQRPTDYAVGSSVGRGLVLVTHGYFAGKLFYCPVGGVVGGSVIWLPVPAGEDDTMNYTKHTHPPVTVGAGQGGVTILVAPGVAGQQHVVRHADIVNNGLVPASVELLGDNAVVWVTPVGARGGVSAAYADGVALPAGAALQMRSAVEGVVVSLQYRTYQV